MSIEVSIIIPAFNEEQALARNIAQIKQYVLQLGISYEICIVNDGSKDKTLHEATACADPHTHVLSYDKNRGKGFAVRHGGREAKGKYILFMDVDLSTSLDAIGEFLRRMRNDEADILIGDRKSDPSNQKIKQPFYRRFLGNGFTLLSRWCTGTQLHDFTCGFKMFNRKAAGIVFSRQQIFNWAFDTELLAIAKLHDLRIIEVPVTWSHHQQGSAVRPIKDIITSLSELLIIRRNLKRGIYK